MPGKDNLVPNSERTREELRAITTKGGIKSGQVRREKKKLRELATDILNLKAPVHKVEAIREHYPEATSNMTLSELILFAQMKKASDGDAKAFELLRDTAGQKPGEVIETVNTNMNTDVTLTDEQITEAGNIIAKMIKGE